DPVEPGSDQRREAEIRVDVAAGNAGLDPPRGALADDAEAARAVVHPPRERRGRPGAGGVALVGVDVRGEEERELPRTRDPPGEEAVEELALGCERVRSVAPEARVHVARASDPRVIGLRHEGD